MKRVFVFLIAMLSIIALNSNANEPTIVSRDYVVNLGVGTSSISYSENYYQNGPVGQLAHQLMSVSPSIQNSLNAIIAESAAADGASFLYGQLQGNPLIQVNPRADGTALMSLSGVSYRTAVKKKIRWLGISWFSCTSTLSVNNVSIVAQYGSVDGQILDESIGFYGSPGVDTNCDSFLSWLLPGVGHYLNRRLQDIADRRLLNGIKSAMGTIKDNLLFRPNHNFLNSLNGLVPANKTILLSNGNVFPVGQYLRDNVAYLAGNSSFTIEISPGLQGIPDYDQSASILYFALNSPAISFDLSLTDSIVVEPCYPAISCI
jgi:hypothetical protein